MKTKEIAIVGLVSAMILVGCTMTAVPAAAQFPSTPFMISGWVSNNTGVPVNNPNVTINNTNMGEIFIAETNVSSNCYQLVLDSKNVSEGDVLEFYATDGTQSNTTIRAVTQGDINTGGVFGFNLTVQVVPVFYDDFTAPDGLNVNETKWRGTVNVQGYQQWSAMFPRIENNTFTIGNGSQHDMNYYVQSNPTFKNGTNSPLILEADVRTSGTDNSYMGEFGFLGYNSYDMWIYFKESRDSPGYLRTVYKIPGGQSYEGSLLSIDPHIWHHYKIEWTGSHIYWYVDGDIVDEAEVSCDRSLSVGFSEDGNQMWADNVTVYGEIFDASPPGCSIVINDGAENTDSRVVTLTLFAEDLESGVTEMRFANDHTCDVCWSDWEPYNTTKAWTLSESYGEKKVYAQYKNGAGLESLAYNDTISLVPTIDRYSIAGYCFYRDGSPAVHNLKVRIRNVNTGKRWLATTSENFYNLTLNVGEDVNATEVLNFRACSRRSDGTVCCNRRTRHTVTQEKIDAGGISNFNITLSLCYKKIPVTPIPVTPVPVTPMPATPEPVKPIQVPVSIVK